MKKMAVLVAAAMAASLTACGSGGSSDSTGGQTTSAGGDGTLTFASNFAETTMDPDLIPIRQMDMYTAPVYDGLTRLDGDLTLKPALATKWKAGSDAKGPYLDFTLRSGLTFDDGTPFTSKTVELNIKRSQTLKGSTNASVLAGVSVQTMDKLHVRLRDANGVGQLPRLLAGPAGMMISDKAITTNEDLTSKEAGIGPFNLESVNPNRVVYTANPDYWDEDAAATKTLAIEYLADDAKLNAVRSGDVDVTILPTKMAETAKTAGYKVETGVGTENYLFAMNTTLKPFDNPKVREAVNLAVDRKGMCQSVLSGSCEPSGQFFSAGTLAYDKGVGLKNFSYDPDRAKQLIDQAGAKGAKVDIVTVAGIDNFVKLATVLQQELKSIGLDASVAQLAPAQVVARFAVKKNAGIAFGATGNAFDPSISLNRYMLPNGLYNPGKFSDDAINKLAAEAMKEADQTKRIAIYRKISSMIKPDGFLIPLMSPETNYVVADHVKGWETPWAPSFPSFRGVSG